MNHLSRTARGALVSLTAVALGGSALVAAAGPASALPEDPDLTGAVVNASGIALPGIDVYAYTTPADGSAPVDVDYASTDATGHYTFTDLDPASLAASYPSDAAVNTETEFKLFFYWNPSTPADFHSTGYLARGLGGTKSLRLAGSVVVPANATATAPTQALPTAGGVLLRILGASGAPVNSPFGNYGDLYEPNAYDPTDALSASGSTGDDDGFYAPNPAPVDGLVYIRGVEPGTSYAVQASGSDYNPTTFAFTNYVSRFFGGN